MVSMLLQALRETNNNDLDTLHIILDYVRRYKNGEAD